MHTLLFAFCSLSFSHKNSNLRSLNNPPELYVLSNFKLISNRSISINLLFPNSCLLRPLFSTLDVGHQTNWLARVFEAKLIRTLLLSLSLNVNVRKPIINWLPSAAISGHVTTKWNYLIQLTRLGMVSVAINFLNAVSSHHTPTW